MEKDSEENPQLQMVEQEPEEYSGRMVEGINPDLDLTQAQVHDKQSLEQRVPSSPGETPQFSTEPVCEAEGAGDCTDVAERISPLETVAFSPVPVDEDTPVQVHEEGERGRRGAAIRAREKILEWTRHLLAVLK